VAHNAFCCRPHSWDLYFGRRRDARDALAVISTHFALHQPMSALPPKATWYVSRVKKMRARSLGVISDMDPVYVPLLSALAVRSLVRLPQSRRFLFRPSSANAARGCVKRRLWRWRNTKFRSLVAGEKPCCHFLPAQTKTTRLHNEVFATVKMSRRSKTFYLFPWRFATLESIGLMTPVHSPGVCWRWSTMDEYQIMLW
jgi:hypothetical protein